MGTGECHHCGISLEEDGLGIRCNYCRELVCDDHRLPENHDCPGLYSQKGSAHSTNRGTPRHVRRQKSSGTTKAPGKAPENTGTKGPDVNLDGSIKTRSSQTPNKPSFNPSTQNTSVITRRRLGAGLLAVLLGGVSAVQTGIIDSPVSLSSIGLPGTDFSSSSDSRSGESTTSTETESSRTTGGSSSGGFLGEKLNIEQVQNHIHEAVNAHRAEENAYTLQYREGLEEVAVYHSEDMAENDYLAHESPSGESMEDRYQKFNIDCRTSGENVAQTWYKERIRTEDGEQYYDTNKALAEGIVRQWLNSPGHRENVLRDQFSGEGIGVVAIDVDDGTKVFATQNFCG